MEGHGRSWKVKEGKEGKEGHGWSFPITGLTFKVRKVIGGGGGGWGGGVLDYIVSPSPSPFPLDIGFWIWILDLDFELVLGLTRRQIDVRWVA